MTITDGAFTMPAADVAVAATFAPDPAHFSVNDAGTEYTIKTATGWNVFCDCLNDNDTYNRFSGKTVRLGADITVTRMAGSSGHDFCGTFDGDGHTLDVNISSDAERDYTAPFSYISNTKANPGDAADSPAAIRNLNVTGTVTATKDWVSGLVGAFWGTLTIEDCTVSAALSTSDKHAAGFISREQGNATIRNCRSSVSISGTVSGDGTHAAFIGGSGSGVTTAIEGCLFDGSLLGTATTHCAGFVGYNSGTLTISNSLFDPADVSVGDANSCTFARYGTGNAPTLTNCYYTRALGTAQGKAPRTVTAADDVTIDAVALTGTATQYTVSGITAYSGGGLQRGQTLYYGSGDQLSLTLSNSATGAPQGYQYGYTASAGTLSGTTLTMPDEDVTISVNTADLATIDWATVNQGDSDDPYMIYNKDQLLLLAHRVNGTNGETSNGYKGKYFKLGADITFSHDADEGDDYAENFEAIGNGYHYFKGNFDGANHTVSGIRIRKDGTGITNNYLGIFGQTSDGSIHDVHLTDARIKGYSYVGGIVGYNGSSCNVSGCTVTDSYITATTTTSNYYGTICGYKTTGYYAATLTNNYYHGCTVNGTAVTSGKGCEEADIAANNGALPAYHLALGANITTPPGTFAGQTEWLDTPPVSARLAPENGFTLAGNHYFASGYEFTPGSTLASGAAQGYTPRATLGDELLDLYTPTGDTDPLAGKAIARLTIAADCDGKTLAAALRSTGQPVTVAYIKADGTPGEANAIALDGTETTLAAGWYFVGKDISYTQTLTLTGNATLILADNCQMNVGTSEGRVSGEGLCPSVLDANLIIYGQSTDPATMGSLGVYVAGGHNFGITGKAITINGGNITADTNGNGARALFAGDGDITINGGNVTVNATGTDAPAIYASGNFNYNGGNVTATAASGNAIRANGNYTFSWRTATDRITIGATGLYATDGKTATFARLFTDAADHYYGGTLTDLSALAGKTLTAATQLVLDDTSDNTARLAAANAMTGLTVQLADRTLYKDGSWNTLCLPFDVTVSGSALDGDGVTIMTLNGTTSSLDANGLLTLNFTDVTTGALTAGTPYIIKWDNTGVNLTETDLVFTGVTIDNTAPTAVTFHSDLGDDCQFVGQYSPFLISDGRDDGDGNATVNNIDQIVMLSSNNTLGYSKNPRTLRSCRAHFLVPTTTSNAPAMARYAINFGDDESTGITTTNYTNYTNSDEWYTLDGRKLDGKPTAAGLYINNGKKIIIK